VRQAQAQAQLPGVAEAVASFEGAIATPRLQLRPVEVTDATAMFALFNDWEIVRWLVRPTWPQAFDAYWTGLRRLTAERRAGRSLYLAIRADGAIIGAAAVTVAEDLANLGYWIGRPHWARGYMTEAAGGLCDWLFDRTREPAIYSGVFDGNLASMRVQRKLGFVQIGTSVHYSTPLQRDLLHLDTKLTRTARRVALEKA